MPFDARLDQVEVIARPRDRFAETVLERGCRFEAKLLVRLLGGAEPMARPVPLPRRPEFDLGPSSRLACE